MSRFHPADRQTGYLRLPSVDEWLPEGYLARCIVEVVDGLDLRALENAYTGRGSAAYHPSVLLALLVYGYANGVFSSRKVERATYDSVAFRFVAEGAHPDADTLATFRRRFLEKLSGLFVQVLEMALEMQVLKLGTISLDGTRNKANAARHSALSHGQIGQREIQLKAEVDGLLAQAEQADQSAVADGMDLPAEIARRQARLEVMAAAKAKVSERAKARSETEQAEFETKMARREQKARESGRKPGGTLPKPPVVPMLALLVALPDSLGQVEQLLADTGCYSAKNVQACQAQGIDPFRAVKREKHHPPRKNAWPRDQHYPLSQTHAVRILHLLGDPVRTFVDALRLWSRRRVLPPHQPDIPQWPSSRNQSLRDRKIRQLPKIYSANTIACRIRAEFAKSGGFERNGREKRRDGFCWVGGRRRITRKTPHNVASSGAVFGRQRVYSQCPGGDEVRHSDVSCGIATCQNERNISA